MSPDHAAHTLPARLERSMLFVPASDWAKIEKAAASPADSVCIDLEDSVAVKQKASSRTNVIRAFRELPWGPRTRMFRINDLETPWAYRDLIEVVEATGQSVDLIMLPKANSSTDVIFLDKLLTQIESHCGLSRRIGIEAQIETAAGFLALREIAQASPRLEALIFGPGDYAASLQIPSAGIGEFDRHDATYPGHRWHAVMHAIVAAARANRLRCVDGPYGAFRDSVGLEKASNLALAMGFDGKQCIHPNQVPVANAIFSPSAQDLAQAERVVAAYERAVGEQRGVVSLEGKMIDAASIRMAQTIFEKQRLIRERQHE